MSASAPARPRVTVDGKFFRLGGRKFVVKGVTYGPLFTGAAERRSGKAKARQAV
jgi:hypothetical protein